MRRAAWAALTALALLVAVYALSGALVPSLRTPFVEALFSEKRLRALGHLGGGGIALATGAFQFSRRLRFERPAIHRLLGRIYLIAVLIAGGSAALLAPVSDGGLPAHVGFGLLAALWLLASGLAFARARGGRFAGHRWLCWVPNLVIAEWLVLRSSVAPLHLPGMGEPPARPASASETR